ncbi:MAG: hypothetical protein JO332_00115, partial [Planctomycetaceae bacterium]|nr:hypothetical protein [Planctomycetaceae bacterium]
MTLLLLILLPALAQEPQVREQAPGLSFPLPKGWSRQDLESKSIAILPPGGDARQCTVLILPAQDVDLGPAEAHDQLFRTATQGSTVEGKVRKSTCAGWTVSDAKVVTAQQQELWTAVYTLQSGKRLEAIMLVAASDALFKTHRPTVEQM